MVYNGSMTIPKPRLVPCPCLPMAKGGRFGVCCAPCGAHYDAKGASRGHAKTCVHCGGTKKTPASVVKTLGAPAKIPKRFLA